MVGNSVEGNGHYITVWAPRQAGKTWVMQEVVEQLRTSGEFEVGIITMQDAKEDKSDESVLETFVQELNNWFDRDFPDVTEWKQVKSLFTADYFSKPVILVIDEFDALAEVFINRFANAFRAMYTTRSNQRHLPSDEKSNLLHGLALIGVRSVLGIENVSGSPFNVQRSVYIPNLTEDEVHTLFHSYEQESGQRIAPNVITRIYREMRGQPGLTCWMGELLTETYNKHQSVITIRDFNRAYALALKALPNNNILNIISKAKMETYQPFVLEMFKTDEKLLFRYDDPDTNYLYMNGVVAHEVVVPVASAHMLEEELDDEIESELGFYFEDAGEEEELYLKFPSPFVQRRLFNYFSHQLFGGLDNLYDPDTDLSKTITLTFLNVPNVMRIYEDYVQKNSAWLFRNAPRRKTDDRIYEAVYHFNLFAYLAKFLRPFKASLVPEFPTGNGKVDLIIRHNKRLYPLELKSYANLQQRQEAVEQAAAYGQTLKVSEVWLIFFIESITDERRAELEVTVTDAATGVVVYQVFVRMG
ncbi:MAG: AAA-like domain-containing protein [Chloroflexota bacterium]